MGNGPFVELMDGSVKYDFINGIGVHHFGHSNPKIIEACLDAALEDTVMQGNLQQNELAFTFSKKLLDLANKNNAGIDHCFLSSTGVMAIENALKIAFQKNAPASRVLSFERCFSGRTLALSQITDKAAYRQGLPQTLSVDYLPFYDESRPEESTKEAVAVLKKYIHRYPKQHAAIVMELIQGEGGFYPGSTAFHKALMEVCRENGIAVIADEVQTFARTYEPFAFQYYQLDKLVDIVTIGKSSQICATLFRKEYKPGPGLLSQTFTSSTTAIAAGIVIIDELAKKEYWGENGRIAGLHNHFEKHFEAMRKEMPGKMSGPYGFGGMLAFTPLDGSTEKVTAFVKKLFENGIISFLTGASPQRVRFLFPIVSLETKHIDDAMVILRDTLKSF